MMGLFWRLFHILRNAAEASGVCVFFEAALPFSSAVAVSTLCGVM